MQANNLKENEVKVRQSLQKELKKENFYQVPVMEKIVLNIGFGKQAPDKKGQEQILADLAKLAGQKPVLTKAKKAIAGFKIRKDQVIGAKVTLRREKMRSFFQKLVNIVLPRLRDFRGLKETSFDKKGNYTIGFSELHVFPEIDYSRTEKKTGLEVTISTSATNDQEAQLLLSGLGMPFRKLEEKKNIEIKV